MTFRSKSWLAFFCAVWVLFVAGASTSSWHNFGGDPQRRWFASATLPSKPALIKTDVVAPPFSGLYMSPAIVGNTLYTFPIRGGALTAYDLSSLQILWQKKFPDSKLANQKSLSTDGNVLLIPFGFTGKVVAIFATTGEIAWSFNVGLNEVPTGTVFYRGMFVFATDKGRVFALSPDGQLIWSRNIEDQVDWFTFVPVVLDSGVLISSLKGMVYVLDWEHGEVVSHFKAPGKGSPAVSPRTDGSMVIAYQTDAGVGISVRRPDNKVVWEAEVTLPAPASPGSPVIGSDRIFVPAGNTIFVFSNSGKIEGKWAFAADASVNGLLALNDGAVVALRTPGASRGSLAFVDAQTWSVRAMFEGEGQFFGPPVFHKGLFVAPNEDGRIYIYR
ncbi:MAG: outer membrane protein assembly factor BamB family protein [bacterium JZ-2024 1]